MYEFFRDQGSFIAGLLALVAGGLAYRAGQIQAEQARAAAELQIKADSQRDDREIDALRKSLATELRQRIVQALQAHRSLRKLATAATKESPITSRMLASASRIPPAVVYPGSAPKIGLLGGGDAMDIVMVHNAIETALSGTAQLMQSRDQDNITPLNVAAVADAFLKACDYSREVLPKFRTGFALHDDKDAELIGQINSATAEWEEILKGWPKLSE